MWTSVCHSQKKHYGYANLAKNPGNGERLSKTIIIFIFTLLFALAKGCQMGEAHCAGFNLPVVCAVDKAETSTVEVPSMNVKLLSMPLYCILAQQVMQEKLKN